MPSSGPDLIAIPAMSNYVALLLRFPVGEVGEGWAMMWVEITRLRLSLAQFQRKGPKSSGHQNCMFLIS